MADAYSSAWWLERLGKELDGRAGRMLKYEQYYAGVQPLAYASKKFRESFATTYGRFADNFCRLVVQAVEERLTVEGFRFGNDRRDRKAWDIWQANQLDKESQKAHREALIKGECSVIVGTEPGIEGPVIRVRPPEQVIVGYGDDPLVRAVALRRWKSIDGPLFATLYYPDRIEKYVARAREGTYSSDWIPRRVPGEDWPALHDLGAVPVVPLINDPGIDGGGTSELEQIIPLQDSLNKLVVDMLVASEFAAFRQRWVTGLDIPVDPETNRPIELFKAAVDRVWGTPSKDAKFGDFDQSDLGPYVTAIETVIQHIATTTRTPAHYLLGQSGSFPSGESLKATETGLVAKANRRTRDLGEGWEEVMRLALAAAGDRVGSRYIGAETRWKDTETRTEAQHVDALLKLSSLGVPEEQLWEDAGYTPVQIARFAEMKGRQPTEAPVSPEAALSTPAPPEAA